MAVPVPGAGVVCGDEPEAFRAILAFDDELREHAVPQLADERFRSRRRAPIPPMWRCAFVDRELEQELVVGSENRTESHPAPDQRNRRARPDGPADPGSVPSRRAAIGAERSSITTFGQ